MREYFNSNLTGTFETKTIGGYVVKIIKNTDGSFYTDKTGIEAIKKINSFMGRERYEWVGGCFDTEEYGLFRQI